MAGVYTYSETSKETLDEWWEEVMKIADYLNQEEIKYFLHCTTLKNKEAILKKETLRGGYTGLPKRAPLASNPEVLGIWIAPSTVERPDRSPYGSHQMRIKVRDLMNFMCGTLDDENDVDDDEKWDAESDEEETTSKGGKKGKRKEKKKKQRPLKKNQKECYAKHKMPQKQQRGDKPLLFFECAHYYGNTQYVRMVLIRASDIHVDWCRVNLKEIDIHSNPLFLWTWGRVFTHTVGDKGRKEVIVELLVIGDILLDKLGEKPAWDTVSKITRAGFDPRLGVLSRYN